ncbi:DEAD/DEAH box helicase [Chryseosolibacter indicus]|uniref:DEAD/DEAH box helicase n=1 Tax=Chryseosolibacter indicus TaxID=2782351 RepID=A0ABS5VNN5_9BACT|nr:DEAD/DEAH box helicase [Chryseosolibacter indicus]MBT1702379.1 DEAD/DEAH box helicase [Chryseosolibacter indicus]
MQSFETLGLSKEIVGAIQKLGFENPTPIQQQAIPVLLEEDQDVVALAQTGTGKTAAFGLPLIDLIDDSDRTTQALVLAPTRELCLQITNDFHNFSKAVKSLNIVAVYGGSSIVEQIRSIKKGAQIIVATPGRLMDLLSRKVINLAEIRFVVLDEADEMLNMGFKDDIDHILSHTSDEKNVWLFSATMPREVRDIANNYMNSPLELTVGERNQSNQNIDHQYVIVDDKDRYLALKRIVDYNYDIFGVVFCRTKADTQRIAEHLIKDGYNADALHGDLTQQQRDRVMKNFKSKALQILVATDVAARGIDVNNITHVIHMNLPDEIEFYTHRSGRTARAGRKGISIALINRRETQKIRQIEKMIKSKFTHQLVPTGVEICEKRVLNIVHRLREVNLIENEIAHFLPSVYEALKDLSKEEIIKRFTSLEFNHFLDYYRDAPDLNRSERTERSERDSAGGRYVTGDRLFINLGKMDGLDASKLLSLICDRSNISRQKIGKIDLKGAYSFFEIEKAFVDTVRDHLHGFEYKGRMVRIEVTESRESGRSGGGSRREESRSRGGSRDRDTSRDRKRSRR